MKLLNIILILLLLIFATACSSNYTKNNSNSLCTDPLGCIIVEPGETIEIGTMSDFSGNAKVIGETQIKAMRLAVEEFGTIYGRNISLQVEDSGCTVEGGANSALRIISNPDIVGTVGTTCSISGVSASKIISNSGLVMVSGSNSAPSLTSVVGVRGENWVPGFFRVTYNGASLGKAAAIFAATELNKTKFATINDGDVFTLGLANTFEKEVIELNGDIVGSFSIDKGDKNMNPTIQALIDANPEVVFLPIFPAEAIAIIQEARKYSELNNVLFVNTDSSKVQDLLDELKENSEGIYFVGHSIPEGITVDNLLEKYDNKYHELPAHGSYVHSYVAMDVLLRTIDSVAKIDKDTNKLVVGKSKLRSALYKINNYEAISGVLSCDKYGDCADFSFDIFLIEDYEKGIEGLNSNVVHRVRS